MKLQKLVTLVAAVLFMAMTSMAFAATQISTGDNSAPIPYATSADNCNKGGDVSFKYERESIVNATDSWIMDLDFGVTLCKTVDLWIKLDPQSAGSLAGSDGSHDIISGQNVAIEGGLYFRVWGDKGERRLNARYYDQDGPIDSADAKLTVGDAATDFFRFALFNQKTDDGILKVFNGTGDPVSELVNAGNATAWTLLFRPATIEDNTLCITHDPAVIAENQKLHFNLYRGTNSPNAFEFVGGKGNQPQIGHFISLVYVPVNCGKEVGRITCETGTGQDGGVTGDCIEFDLEEGTAYCDYDYGYNWHKRGLVVEAKPAFEPAKDYSLGIEILVDGQRGDNGVYFARAHVGYLSTSNKKDACECNEGTKTVDADKWYRHGDAEGTMVAPSGECDKTPYVRMDTKKFSLEGERYLALDLPSFIVDASRVAAGARISVAVTIKREPCVILGTFTKEIGIMCCEGESEGSHALYYPYLTPMQSASWWCGVVVTNLTNTGGTVDLDFYEQGGASASYTTPAIAPYSMYVELLENIPVTGLTGDERLWMKAESVLNIDGFAMMGQGATGQSMGYLPRQQWQY